MMKREKVLLLFGLIFFTCGHHGNAQVLAMFKEDNLGKQQVYDSVRKVVIKYNEKDTVISNKHILHAMPRFSDYNDIPMVSIRLTEEGKMRFAKATKVSIGKSIIIMVDDQLISAPLVQSEIAGGKVAISGGFSIEKAQQLAEALKSGYVIEAKKRQEQLLTEALKSEYEIAATKLKAQLLLATQGLERALVGKEYEVLSYLLDDNLLMGHSNGYFQTKEELITDLKQGKIMYESFEQLGGQDADIFDEAIRIHRKVAVKGKYTGVDFEMKLAVMEIWKNTKTGLKLWSRQAVKIKE